MQWTLTIFMIALIKINCLAVKNRFPLYFALWIVLFTSDLTWEIAQLLSLPPGDSFLLLLQSYSVPLLFVEALGIPTGKAWADQGSHCSNQSKYTATHINHIFHTWEKLHNLKYYSIIYTIGFRTPAFFSGFMGNISSSNTVNRHPSSKGGNFPKRKWLIFIWWSNNS